MNIHEIIAEKTELAKTYASDGAFRSAARVLRQLVDTIENHVDACDAAMDERFPPKDDR